jgi:hypothetical protein
MRIIEHDRILELYDAARSANLFGSRDALLTGIDASVIAHLRRADSSASQFLCDLDALNRIGRTVDGDVPLAVWLKNAIALTYHLVECTIFQQGLDACLSDQLGEAALSTAPGTNAPLPWKLVEDALTFVVPPGDDAGFCYTLSTGNIFVASVRSNRQLITMVAPEPSYRRWLADEVVEAAVGEGDTRHAELWFVVPQGGEHVLWVENLDKRHKATVNVDVFILRGAADPEIE